MFQTIQLPNGLQIVAEKIPFVRSVALGIWVKNGVRNETKAENGLSHFIEHMLFKGTEKRTAADIAEEIDAIGGQLNAYTSKEYTCYYTLSLDTHADTALDVLVDMYFHSRFDEVDIKKETNVVLEEISMVEDSPEDLAHDLLHEKVWPDDSLGYRILGEAVVIETFDHAACKDYCNRHYRPDNTVIALAGNFCDDMIDKITARFGYFTRDSKAFVPMPPRYIPTMIAKEKDIEQLHFGFGFPGVAVGAEDMYTVAVLNAIFGGGMSSRLFQKIREEHGLAYSVYSQNESYSDTGLFSIYAGLNPAQAAHVIALTIGEIKRLFADPIKAAQIAKAKEQLKSSFMLGLESSSSRMSAIGRSQLMLGKIRRPEDILAKIDTVTPEAVQALIRTIFDFEQMSFCAVGPVDGMAFTEMINRAKN